MAGSPKKRARRLAASATLAGARARELVDDLLKAAKKQSITPVPPSRLPADEELFAIAKGVLLAVARRGQPQEQVKAAWNLADLARRSTTPRARSSGTPDVPPGLRDLEQLSDDELSARAEEAAKALGSPVQ